MKHFSALTSYLAELVGLDLKRQFFSRLFLNVCLLYAPEVCPVNRSQRRLMEFTVNRAMMKIFSHNINRCNH